MCSPFSCSSFKNWKEYDIDELPTPIKTPKIKSSKSFRSYSSKRRDRDGKNPYANQGLDKFAALLAELEAKKQKIYTQKGSGDISVIYFTYTKSDEFQPFIVKVKKQQHTTNTTTKIAASHKELKKRVPEVVINKGSIEASARVDEEARQQRSKKEVIISYIRKTHSSFKIKFKNDGRHIFSYLPVTIILILLLLALSGRSFAILCITVAWYLVPILSTKTVPVSEIK